MATEEGFVPLFRSIRKHWIWQDSNKLKWWIDILMEVNHESRKVNIGNQIIMCERGQSLNSLTTWAKRWGVDRSTVRRFFGLLEKDSMIVTKSVVKTTHLTVCNYVSYNDWRPDRARIVPASSPHRARSAPINNNDNNDNNGNKENAAETSSSGGNKKNSNLVIRCEKIYISWMMDETGIEPEINAGGRAAMKKITSHIRALILKRDSMKTDEEADNAVCDGWTTVLKNKERWPAWEQGRLRLVDIHSNLTNILNSIRNGTATTKNGSSNASAQTIRNISGVTDF